MPGNVEVVKNRRWENWHQTVGSKVARQVALWNANPSSPTLEGYNDTTAALQGLLQEALDNGWTVRCLGGGWSFSPVALTDGMLINTRPLNYQFRIQDHLRHADCTIAAENLQFAQCGTGVAELSYILGQRGKSLSTTGASNGQTIAGAISTGTHGAALDVGAVHDRVRGLHLITSPTRHVWLERASAPTLADTFAGKLGAELIRDDALFDAAVVGLGGMGLVHGVLLEVEDRFTLQVYKKHWPLTAEVWAAIDRLDFAGLALPRPASVRPYHFQVIINPYDDQPRAYLSVMYKDAVRPADARPIDRERTWAVGDDLPEILSRILAVAPTFARPLVSGILAGHLGDVDGECGALSEVFTNTTTRGKLASAGVGIPLGRVQEAVTALLDLARNQNFAGLLALRYVKSSRATLAFTRRDERTCILELDGCFGAGTDRFYDHAWNLLLQRGIPFAFHWGKMQRVDPQLTRTMYGPAVDAWRAARERLLPDPAHRALFANRMLRELGLAD